MMVSWGFAPGGPETAEPSTTSGFNTSWVSCVWRSTEVEGSAHHPRGTERAMGGELQIPRREGRAVERVRVASLAEAQVPTHAGEHLTRADGEEQPREQRETLPEPAHVRWHQPVRDARRARAPGPDPTARAVRDHEPEAEQVAVGRHDLRERGPVEPQRDRGQLRRGRGALHHDALPANSCTT